MPLGTITGPESAYSTATTANLNLKGAANTRDAFSEYMARPCPLSSALPLQGTYGECTYKYLGTVFVFISWTSYMGDVGNLIKYSRLLFLFIWTS